jgi:hypothetical protein
MRNEHYRQMLEQNQNAGVGFSLAAAMVYAARYGSCEPEHHSTDEWKTIARRLKSEYGENLTADECSVEMDRANQSAAGAKLRAIRSDKRSEQSRVNGKKSGGRPPKTQPTPGAADGGYSPAKPADTTE